MRKDRLLLAAALTTVFSADLYFILLPKLRSIGQGSRKFCSCGPSNLTLPRQSGLATPHLSESLVDGTTTDPTGGGSKLGRLFAHPLHNIQTPALGPEERLLQVEQLMEYYRKKMSRWERLVYIIVFKTFLKSNLDIVYFVHVQLIL